jgi:glycosyltransferase involved in cell wall biosynthesis
LKKRIFYIVSGIQKSLSFEWTALELKKSNDLTFVLLNPASSSLESYLKENGVRTIRVRYRSKRDAPFTFLRLCFLFFKESPEIIHAHMFDASLLGLLAAWTTQIKTRIYTRHTSTFHHMYFPNAVKYDRLINRLSTHIISISQATDFALLQLESVPFQKLRKIPHGFNLKEFTNVDDARVHAVKLKWKIADFQPCIGVIARHIEWKGLQYILPAFQKFQIDHPKACLILANATGPYHEKVIELIKNIPPENVIQIPFEEDIAALYRLFDLYVHAPIDATCEAFGQTYIEAMASGIPSVFTLSGIATEYVKDGINALVVDYKNSDQIYDAITRLWKDSKLQEDLTEMGYKSVDPAYSLSGMVLNLKKLYDE